MKYIRCAPDITVGDKPFSMADYVRFLVKTCKEFNSTGDGIRAGIRIEDALEGSVVKLKNEHYELLLIASETPTQGYPGFVSIQDGQRAFTSLSREMLPFIDAIKNAVDEEPDSTTDAR